MTEQNLTSLFDEMDAIDGELNRDPTYVREDSQIAFRALQKKALPDLTKEEFLNLFRLWEQRKIDQLRAELAKTRAALAAADRERHKLIIERDICIGLPADTDFWDACAIKAQTGPEGLATLARQLLDGQGSPV